MTLLWQLFRNWLSHRFCVHEWTIEKSTYAPPLSVTDGLELMFLEYGEPRERAMHGCTTVLKACKRCGATYAVTLLGKSHSDTPLQLVRSTRGPYG